LRCDPFKVVTDPDGGCVVIVFSDLPGCLTQVDDVDDISPMAKDARITWADAAFDQVMEIPELSIPEEYSGRFNLRLPRSLLRELAEEARRQGVSLNQYVETLLARRDALARVERLIAERLLAPGDVA
jgi:antitoxin HicB